MGPRDRDAAVLVSITLAVAAFAVGSAPRWAACLTATLCLLTAIPLLRSRRYLNETPLLLLFLLLAIAVTAVQVVPLPSGVIGFVSPHRWQLVEENTRAWGISSPDFLTLSYDYPGTLVEMAKLTGYFAFSYTCLWLSGSSRGRRWLLSSAVIVASAMAFTAIAHHLVGAKKLYGIYEPHFPAPPYMAPLLNPNHLAALFALATPLSVGLAASTQGSKRATWIGLGLLCTGVGFLTESRAGAIALGVGVSLAGWMIWRQNRRGLQTVEINLPRNVIVPAIIIMGCALALVVAFTAGGVAQELSRTTTEQITGEDYKLDVWRSSKTLMYEHPWTGVGRGAFEHTFTRVHPSGEHTFSHVENEYLQTILDWGFPTAVGLAVLLGLMVLAASRRTMAGPLEAGAIGGLVALGLHNFVDFNLEFPAVALPALAALTVVLPGKPREARSPGRRRVVRVGLVAAGIAAISLAALPLGAASRDEAAALSDDLDAAMKKVPDQSLVDRALRLTSRHPSDYVGFGLAARALFRKGETRAVHLINRALYLNFEHSGLHWLAGQMLASTESDRDQALVEYSLSLRTARDPRPILADLLARFPSAEMAARAVPRAPELAERMCYHLSLMSRDDVALLYVQHIHIEIPDNPDMAGLVSDYALLRGQPDVALTTAQQAHGKDPSARNSARLARALNGSNRSEEAEQILEAAILRVRAQGSRYDLVSLMTLLGDTQRMRGRLSQAKDTLIGAADLAPDRKRRAAIHRSLAQVEDALGNPTVAAVERQRAEELDPSDVLPLTTTTIYLSLPFLGTHPLNPAPASSTATGGVQPTGTPAATGGGQPTGTPAATGGGQPTGTPAATGGGQPTGTPAATGGVQPTGRTAVDLWPLPKAP